MKQKLKLVLIIFSLSMMAQSCKSYKVLSLMYSKEATFDDFSNGEKDIRFVNMVHLSTPDFYADVIEKVKFAKQNDYVLFYEYIDFDIATDLEKRKIRKMTGFIPSPAGYQKLLESSKTDDLVIQDNNEFLNLLNQKDYRVDITPSEIIEKYETKFGKIILTEEDKNTPIEETMKVSLSEKQVHSIILDYRNEYLAEKVEASDFSKILILYGAAHNKGFFKELKRLNPKWETIKRNK